MPTRSIKGLLELMLENKHLFVTGLCYLNNCLHTLKLINVEEHYLLSTYIDENRPSIYSSIAAFKSRKSVYFWKRGDIKPRIKWIKKHIKLNS